MSVAALVTAIVALVLSGAAVWFAHQTNRRDAARRHDELAPEIEGEWKDGGVTLRLLSGGDGGYDDADVHLANHQFKGSAEGHRAPFDETLGHPWPIGYDWRLPALAEDHATRVSMTVTCGVGKKSWTKTVTVDAPNTLPPRAY